MSSPTSDPGVAAPESDDPPSLVGTLLSGRYRIEKELGVGGMGTVYRAEHTHMRKHVAVKVLHPEMMQLPEVVARFEREAMAAAHMEHPNVAAATDFGKLEDGSFFLVLEFVEGLSLRDLLDQGPLSPSRALHIASQMCSALVRAHSLGIVHRDLKPDNVMLVERDGDADFAKVLDFGIAKVPVHEITKSDQREQALTRLGMVYGTPEYMAPEQAMGQEVDARADLYALGVILYEMFTGSRPFDADNPVTLLGLQVTQPPAPFRERAPSLELPAQVEQLVMALLEKEASKRPADARQVYEALEQLKLSTPEPGIAAVNIRSSVASHPESAEEFGSAPTGFQMQAPEITKPGVRIDVPAASAPTRVSRRLPSFDWKASLVDLQTNAQSDSARRLLNDLVLHLPAPLVRTPVAAMGGALAAAAAFVLLFGVALIAWDASTPDSAQSVFGTVVGPNLAGWTAERKSHLASEKELAAAAKKGPKALEELATAYPSDAKPLLALGAAHAKADRYEDSMKAYERMLAIDKRLALDPELQKNVFRAVQYSSSEQAALSLMRSKLGALGIDMLYELAYGGSVKGKLPTKAKEALGDEAVKKRGSEAVKIAIDFRKTKKCDNRHSLLPRAKAHGDKRTLTQITRFTRRRGCGFFRRRDCYPCMRKDSALTEAVAAIEARIGKGAK